MVRQLQLCLEPQYRDSTDPWSPYFELLVIQRLDRLIGSHLQNGDLGSWDHPINKMGYQLALAIKIMPNAPTHIKHEIRFLRSCLIAMYFIYFIFGF